MHQSLYRERINPQTVRTFFMLALSSPVPARRRDARRACALATVVALFACAAVAATPEIVIGVLDDGPAERTYVPVAVIEREARALLDREFNLSFPSEKRVNGAWQTDKIRDQLRVLLADPQVDVIMTTGLISTHVAAHLPQLDKPVIGIAVADSELQRFPKADAGSGKANFVYLANDQTVGADLDLFHRITGYQHLAIPVDRLVIEALPELPELVLGAANRLKVKIATVDASDNAAAFFAALPADADAVYIPPLSRFSHAQLKALVDGLIARRLPSFSLIGHPHVDLGVLMTGAGRDVDATRAARRIALNLQSILLGDAASELKVALKQPQKLAINMATARAIGFSPRWRDLENAIVVNAEPENVGTETSLVAALQAALEQNLALKVSEFSPLLAETEVQSARSALLPQLDVGAGANWIDQDRALPLGAAERDGDLSLDVQQLIYSERVWAGYRIAAASRRAEDHALRVAILDTLEQTATAYLNLLTAQAQAAVRASNAKVTERNLELAIERERVGQSGRADVLRFRSELAIDRQNVYTADAQVETAMVELKRILNLPSESDIAVSDTGIPALVDLLANERYQRFFNNFESWKIFRSYSVETALANAPELDQVLALREGAERSLLAAKRAFYVPDVSIVGQAATRVLRGGRGASLAGTGLDDDEWVVGMQATLPLTTGGERRAEKSRARYELMRTDVRLAQLETDIRARTLAALERTTGSYPAIRLAREAAEASRDNLDLITDSYSAGAASITELNDAQDAALTAQLSEAQARYQFMIDLVAVLRATADFDLLLLPDGMEAWYQTLTTYFNERTAVK